ncbi:MAG TPA: S9 family peptidase [Gemmatimonadales bacterium]|jgi:dipeptidyl aminopeptidase/acylaminoacyl peptidase|nr:S9 family peptidase [Gemmatimonadales bacterium]
MRHPCTILLAATLLCSSQPAWPQAKRPITERDLFNFTWVADPHLSPDGSRVAFTRVVVDDKRTGYETSIWTVATTGNEPPVRMTNGKHDAGPRWSADGSRIAFVRGGDKDEDGKPRPPQIAVLSLRGGEAWTITDLPKGAGHPVWSPDGRRIAFLSTTLSEDIEKGARKKSRTDEEGNNQTTADTTENTAKPDQREPESEHESDVHLITRAIYRDNDQGYADPKRHAHIWVLDVPTTSDELTKPTRLTSGSFDESDPLWTPDGARIYFTTARIDEPYYELPTTDIYSVPSSGGELQKLTTIPMAIGDIALSPNGRRLAFHGSVTHPIRSYSEPDTWVMDLAPNAQPRNLTASYDFDMGSSVGGDNAAPRGGGARGLYWSGDGNALFDIVNRQGHTALVRVDAQSGAVADITRGDQAVLDFSVSPQSRVTVALVSTPVQIGDLFTVGTDGEQRRISDFNHKLWSQLNLTPPEELTYTSFDGKRMQAWIQRPPDFDPKKKYPLILNIHGGPHAAYGWVFDHEFQWMAAKGYVVLYVNPRGSTGYGQEFGNIIQYKYPGDDYRDLMAGVDELLRRGYLDPKKLGVTGGSGGGVLTNWTITHTDRFAAAVSQRDIASWSDWWYTADFTLFHPNWFKAPPFQDPEEYANRSAITFVRNIKTPVMFVLGEEDSRTPAEAGGMQLFRALKFLKRPTAMVIFPRETHELSRSGEPWHRIERLQHIVGWFDKYLMGVPHPEYDVRPEKQVPAAEQKAETQGALPSSTQPSSPP